MNRLLRAGWLVAAASVMTSAAAAQTSASPSLPGEHYRWITLGTMGGPQPTRERHEPANALARDGATYVVDVGDGVAGQMTAAGLPIGSLKAIFISHLHFDHVGGLFGLLVSGMIDLDAAVAKLPLGIPAEQRRILVEHLRDHHLSTRQVGDLARQAGIKTVVLTHIAAGGAPDAGASARYGREVAAVTGGPVVVAGDLEVF